MAKALHNTKNRKELIEERLREGKPMYTLSFYAYAHIGNPQFRDHLYSAWEPLGVLGRVHVAKGINAQIAYLLSRKRPGSYHEEDLFFERHSTQLCRRRKKPLLLQGFDQGQKQNLFDGLEDETFDVTNKGRHLDAQEFNEKPG